MLAVMIQDRNTLDNWQWHSASYVVEVQKLVDRMLPTRTTRAARAIAGSSKGGFGAMHIALANPESFSVVESWLGYFNHLGGELEETGRSCHGSGCTHSSTARAKTRRPTPPRIPHSPRSSVKPEPRPKAPSTRATTAWRPSPNTWKQGSCSPGRRSAANRSAAP